MLIRALKKIHTYAGLLTFVNLMVYGIVGLSITFLRQESPGAAVVSYRNYTVEPNLTDLQVAARIATLLNLTLAMPVRSFVIDHNAANDLVLDLRHVNGRHLVTVLEKEGRIRVETTRNSIWHYFFTLHETTAAFQSADWRMQFWADYNEFAMWSLLAMLASGFAMFLAARAGSRLAQVSFAAGSAIFAALYMWTR